MASYEELLFDWSLLPLCKDFKTWTQTDLQLAAELGKTLLERNKELECNLKHHQLVIDDQAQEIEYLTKQTGALRAANESRLKLYENLEVSILDLERGNHRLSAENASLQKQNKSLKSNGETSETRCEELTKLIDELNEKFETERKKTERITLERIKCEDIKTLELKSVNKHSLNKLPSEEFVEKPQIATTASENMAFSFNTQNMSSMNENCNSSSVADQNAEEAIQLQNDKNDEMLGILSELETTKRQYFCEQQRVSELEEQMNALIQENRNLQNRTVELATNEEMKSMQDELSILEEVRYGKMCGRCLRNIDDDYTVADEDESVIDQHDGTLRDTEILEAQSESSDLHSFSSINKSLAVQDSLAEEPHSSRQIDNTNPYRELVEKYEALMEVQRHPIIRNAQMKTGEMDEEFGDLLTFNTKANKDSLKYKCHVMDSKNFKQPLSDFSEAETSSSGFADEISNKFTQTDETFLCTIADGDDKFSIYDGARPIDSRFRNRPEYRELFKEIFAILKKAAENKDDGENLPLLDDSNSFVKVPPVTPAVEELPLFIDDTESIVSSAISEHSVAMSERITRSERKNVIETIKHIEKNEAGNKLSMDKHVLEDGRVLTPLKREPLEYLSVSVNIRKKKKKSKNTFHDRSDSPLLPTPPRVYYSGNSKKRRELRPLPNFPSSPGQNGSGWNGNSVTIYNQNLRHATSAAAAATASASEKNSIKKSPDVKKVVSKDVRKTSTASQDLHKLISLDLSYAEVLRRADQSKYQPQRRKF